ncbi:MAG: PAS domain-containing protein, partial [Planctomycetes bacterium]|nr:PAS domain-containing protein [Planctomycetota bacterium]
IERLAKPLAPDALRRRCERRLCLGAAADAPLICAMLDNAPFAATLWSLERRLLLYANPALGRMLKIRDRNDWVGNHYDHQPRCQPDGAPSPEAAAERLAEAAGGGSSDFVWTYIDGEGDMVPAWVSLRRVRPAPCDLAVGYVLDLRRDTEIKRVIRNERDHLRGIVDASPVPIVRAADEAIVRCNPAAERTFALRPGQSPAEFFCDPQDFAAVSERLRHEGEVDGRVARLRRKDGTERRFLVKAIATTFEDRPGMMLWLIDVEDLCP